MVDFKKILEDRKKNMTPEQKERLRLYEEKEERSNISARDISATVIWRSSRPQMEKVSLLKIPNKSNIVSEKNITVKVRIEESTDYKDNPALKINFIGDIPTPSRYYLDKDFVEAANNQDFKNWALCAGTDGRYPEVTVSMDDVRAYLDEVVPGLRENPDMPIDEIVAKAYQEETPSPKM